MQRPRTNLKSTEACSLVSYMPLAHCFLAKLLRGRKFYGLENRFELIVIQP